MQSKAVVDEYQLSPQQARIWSLQQAGGSQTYRTQSAILIVGELDVERLRSAITVVTNRHEILRTNFHLLPGMAVPLQVIESHQVMAFQDIVVCGCEPHERLARFEEFFQEETKSGFDIERGPAARFYLFTLSASEKILVTSLPSVCADSRSLKNLFREIAGAYAARPQAEETTGQPVQYVDFTEWQKEILEQINDGGASLSWQRINSSSSSPLMLNLECETKPLLEFKPDRVSSTIDTETITGIDRLCSAYQVSAAVLLLACWQLLAWRLTDQKDITIENLCEGRSIEELREAIGAYACFCPVLSHFEPDYQFAERLEIVDRSIKSANEHFAHILWRGGRMTNEGDLADRAQAIGFEYEEWPEAERAGMVTFTYWRQYCCIDRFKLKLGLYRKVESLTLEMQYDSALFSRRSIELIQERYLRLIEGAIANERALIVELELVGRTERERLLIEWNATERRLTDRRCVHELIAEQSCVRPEAIAVVHREEWLSYGELERRANQLAHALRAMGVGPDCVVGLYLERSTASLIGLLGIQKAGGAYLPLEVGGPKERLCGMLKDAGVKVVVTSAEAVASLPAGEWDKVMVGEDWGQLAGYSWRAPKVEVNWENLAYVIYTSGSTGRPKGVMIRHGSVINLLEWLESAIYEGREWEVVSVNAPLSFDSSVKQVVQLSRGRRLCLAGEDERVEPESMMEYLRNKEVEVLDCTPSQWRMLVLAGLMEKEWGPGMVLVGGEAIDVRNWEEMSGDRARKYYNVYGPSECTVDATVCEVSAGSRPAIGRPIINTQIYIVDERGDLAPIGKVGEIYIGGAGVGRGYVGEAGLTGERFTPDPYGSVRGERLYRTGDLGRYLEDGRIEYVGRRDEQVKVRGYRIELGEVREVLRSHPRVRDAVVKVREDEPGEKRLVGYVTWKKEAPKEGAKRGPMPNGMEIVGQNRNGGGRLKEPRELLEGKGYEVEKEQDELLAGTDRYNRCAIRSERVKEIDEQEWAENRVDEAKGVAPEEELRKYVREKLPSYMAPAAIVVMEELPLTRNGKIDMGALPEPEAVKKEKEGREQYQNAYEEIIAGIWNEVLRVGSVSREDNFFEIGGHSLLATQVISRVKRTFGVEIGVKSIFEEPTVKGLAKRVAEAIRAGGKEEAPPLVRASREERLPLSFAQERLWFLDQMEPNSPLYNCPAAVRLEGQLNLEALEFVVNEIVRRHEVLRTRIEVEAGEPVQVIDQWEPRRLEWIDLTGLARGEREEEARRLGREEAGTGFDLSRGPLLRVKVLKLEEEEHVALFTMHHIASDGWSNGVLIREFRALYRAYCAGEPSPLAELPIQYADFAVWQRKWLTGAALEQELKYWREQLSGKPPVLNLAGDRPRPLVPTYRGATRSFALSAELSQSLEALSNREGVTLFMLLLAAFKTLIYRYTAESDIVVGAPVANRNRSEIEPLIGFFVNLLPIRTDLSDNPRFTQLLKKLRGMALDAYAHQDLPFEKLVEELQFDRGSGQTPLINITFGVQNAPKEEIQLTGLKISHLTVEHETARFDLTLWITEVAEALWVRWTYRTDIFDEDTIVRMHGNFETLLSSIVAQPDTPLDGLEMLSEAEKTQQAENRIVHRESNYNQFKNVKPVAITLSED
jgi:amino acid adenylation domain-containing protein